jgi:hypothetical protein
MELNQLIDRLREKNDLDCEEAATTITTLRTMLDILKKKEPVTEIVLDDSSDIELPDIDWLTDNPNRSDIAESIEDYGDRRAAAATLAERERCALICQERADFFGSGQLIKPLHPLHQREMETSKELADAIRQITPASD